MRNNIERTANLNAVLFIIVLFQYLTNIVKNGCFKNKPSSETATLFLINLLYRMNLVFFVKLVTVDADLCVSSLFKEVEGNLRELCV